MSAMLLLLGEYRSHLVVKTPLKCLSFCTLIVYFYAFSGSLNFCSYYAEKTWLDQAYYLHLFLFGFVESPYFSGLVV